MHVIAKLLQALLVGHAEPLFLIHHQQPEVTEPDVLAQQPVGADHQIHRSVHQSRNHGILFPRRPEAAQDVHLHRKGLHPPTERLEVLHRKDGCRHKHRNLLAFLDRLEGRPYRHFGLAEPDIPADQAVHRLGPFHVLLDVGDRLHLVGRLHEREGLLQVALPLRVRAERMRLRHVTGRVEDQQLLSHFRDRLLDPVLCALPLAPAQLAQGRDVLARTHEPLNPVKLVGRHIDLVRPLELQQEVLALPTLRLASHQTLVLGNPVLHMHNHVANREFPQETLLGVPAPTHRPPWTCPPEDLHIRQDDQPQRVVDPPLTRLSLHQRQAWSRRLALQGLNRRDVQSMVRVEFRQPRRLL